VALGYARDRHGLPELPVPLLISLFVGWVWGVKAAGVEVQENDGKFPLGRTWAFLIQFVAPAAIVAILVKMVVDLV